MLLAGLCATLLASLATWLAVERISVPLRRLAETMSAMARTGQLESGFRSSGGNRDVHLIEETFRALLVSLEESQRARERSYVEAVGAVVTAADARDHETTGHSFRVALYAIALARALGLPAEQLKAIEWGALLHDVGKMAVPDGVLRKPGPLTANEWHIMKQHPTWGFDMLAEVSFLQPAAIEIVYSHHERWDGQGYPRSLGGEQIPLAARVFAVGDTYDAITSDRPYRRARCHAAAIAELRREPSPVSPSWSSGSSPTAAATSTRASASPTTSSTRSPIQARKRCLGSLWGISLRAGPWRRVPPSASVWARVFFQPAVDCSGSPKRRRRGSGGCRWQRGRGSRPKRGGHIRGVTPEALEGIEPAGLFLKDVDDQVAIVEQHPLGAVVALDVQRAHLLAAQPLLHRVGDRLHLALAGAAADQEVVGEVAHLLEVQDLEIDRLAIFGGSDSFTDSGGGVGEDLWLGLHRYKLYLCTKSTTKSGIQPAGGRSPRASSSRSRVEDTS